MGWSGKRNIFLLSFLYLFGSFFKPSESICSIHLISELRGNAPLILNSGNTASDGTTLLVPGRDSVRGVLNARESVEFACPGDNNRFNLSGVVRDVSQIEARCESDSNFALDEVSYSLNNIRCTHEPQISIRDGGICSGDNKKLQMGYPVTQSRFITLIDLCYNENSLTPLHLNYILKEGIEHRQETEELESNDRRDYFGNPPISPESNYICTNQQTFLSSLLNSQSRATSKIVCGRNSNYLVKTHLAQTADFVYHSQQRAAQFYVNTVPMWLSIANGNWGKLEAEIRLYASNTSRIPSDLIIYTGTHGVTTLPNNGNSQTPIYLASGNRLPVPKWVWKVVYEPSVQEGIVFILVNNPYQLNFIGCSCVCAQTEWTRQWNRQDKSKGYVYCCTVDNFRRIYSGLPSFPVSGLLKKSRHYNRLDIDVEAQK